MEKKILGIDIGSIAVSTAILNDQKEILHSGYQFHEGDIINTIKSILGDTNFTEIAGVAVTSSSTGLFKNHTVYDTRVSIITASKHFHNDAGTILIVGGEKFGLVTFDNNKDYLNYRSNTSCAAGTGSFLDQQAQRLNLGSIEEFCEIAYKNSGDIPKIASRCAVFAKTDLIHSQQEGYSLNEICDGLCHGLAKNIVDTLFSDNKPNLPLIFTGGVSKNKAVVKHIEQMIEAPLIVDEHSHLYGAIGAAISLIDEKRENIGNFQSINDFIHSDEKEKQYYYDALELKLSEYPQFESHESYEYTSKIFDMTTPIEIDIYEKIKNNNDYSTYVGIDIGSTSTKAVLMDSENTVIAGFYTRTSGRPLEAIQTIFESIHDIEEKEKIKFNIFGVGTTGSGRKFVGEIIGSDLVLDEITAHARAATELDPEVDTIIEIGGQDAKFTTLKSGMVTLSIMNNVCAAGTGSFIEEQAKKLGCPLTEYSKRAENTQAPLSSDRCTVFMERDLNHYLNEHYTVDEILASVLHSVRENYLTKVAVENSIGKKIFFQGATAKNRALVAAFEQRLGKPIMVSKYCHLTGALGVALTLKEMNLEKSGFRGIDLYKETIPVRAEVCELCTNHCKIKIASIKNEEVAYGFLCGRDYKTNSFVQNNSSDFDLLKERRKVFGFKPETVDSDITMAIPASLHLVQELPLWRKFFDTLGIKTITSENYKDGIKEGKQLAQAEFCAPIAALHGHVNYLSQKADHIFLPFYLEEKQKSSSKRRQYCYYTQFAPSIIDQIEKINSAATLHTPILRSISGNFNMKVSLYKTLKSIAPKNFGFMQVSKAYDSAVQWFKDKEDSLRNITHDVENENDIQVVLIGRPYSILSKSMNNGIPDIFGRNGIKSYFQDMIDYEKSEVESIEPLLNALHWNYASQIIEMAEVVAKRDNLYPVLVTSFKCAPDSMVTDYFKQICESHDKPYLILQLDEHDSSVGYETRIEAGIRSFRNHFKETNEKKAAPVKAPNPIVTTNTADLKDKTLLMPNWDNITNKLIVANLQGEGFDARLLEETDESISESMRMNSGQCIPLNAIVQSAIDYVEKYNLDPEKTALWLIDSSISCNLGMFSYFTKTMLEQYGKGMEKITIYGGETTFIGFSVKTAINAYFAFMFGGMIKKIGVQTSPL